MVLVSWGELVVVRGHDQHCSWKAKMEFPPILRPGIKLKRREFPLCPSLYVFVALCLFLFVAVSLCVCFVLGVCVVCVCA